MSHANKYVKVCHSLAGYELKSSRYQFAKKALSSSEIIFQITIFSEYIEAVVVRRSNYPDH